MAVALFWIGFPYLMMGFSHAYWMMLACATLLGIGNNLWHPTAIPWLADRFPERKGLVMSFHSMGGNVGDAVAPLVVGALLTVFSWRDVVLMNVIPGIVMSALILVYIGRLYNAEKSAGVGRQKAGADERRGTAAVDRGAADRSRRGDAVGRLDLPHHDAKRAADIPAGLSRPATWAIRRLDRRLHVRAAGRGLHRRADRRAPVRHASAGGRSSSPACR